MPDKKQTPTKGEPGHFRYTKDLQIDKNRAARGRATLCKRRKPSKKEIEESNKSTTLDKKEEEKTPLQPSFTEEGAKKLKRKEQEKLLKSRGVKFSSKDKEADLVKKIVNSNPK